MPSLRASRWHLGNVQEEVKKAAVFNDKTKALVIARAKNLCELCGLPTSQPQYHHRNPRRMGGTSRESLGWASNALYLHPQCHENVERNRTKALENGWLCYSNDAPSEIPVLRIGEWVLLNDDGTITLHPAVREAEGKRPPHCSSSSTQDH